MNIDFAMAREMALDYLESLSREPGGVSYTIFESLVREEDDGWYFPYQSTKYIETGNFGDSLVGNWPIFVSRSGDYVGSRRPGMPLFKSERPLA